MGCIASQHINDLRSLIPRAGGKQSVVGGKSDIDDGIVVWLEFKKGARESWWFDFLDFL